MSYGPGPFFSSSLLVLLPYFLRALLFCSLLLLCPSCLHPFISCCLLVLIPSSLVPYSSCWLLALSPSCLVAFLSCCLIYCIVAVLSCSLHPHLNHHPNFSCSLLVLLPSFLVRYTLTLALTQTLDLLTHRGSTLSLTAAKFAQRWRHRGLLTPHNTTQHNQNSIWPLSHLLYSATCFTSLFSSLLSSLLCYLFCSTRHVYIYSFDPCFSYLIVLIILFFAVHVTGSQLLPTATSRYFRLLVCPRFFSLHLRNVGTHLCGTHHMILCLALSFMFAFLWRVRTMVSDSSRERKQEPQGKTANHLVVSTNPSQHKSM